MATHSDIGAYLEIFSQEDNKDWDYRYYAEQRYWTAEYKKIRPACTLNLELNDQCLYIHIALNNVHVRSDCKGAIQFFLLRLNDELPIVKFGFDENGIICLMAEVLNEQVSFSTFKNITEIMTTTFEHYYREIELLANEGGLAQLMLEQSRAVDDQPVSLKVGKTEHFKG